MSIEEEDGIFLDLFPPLSWDADGICEALRIQAQADLGDEDEEWNFSEDELRFISESIAYYMSLDTSEWHDLFEINEAIDLDEPNETGRYIINMAYPDHLEPPASLR